MDHACLVRRGQPGGDLPRDGQCPRDRQWPRLPEDVRERLTLDERHRQVLDAADLPQVVDADHVAVGDLPRQEQLPLEPPLDVAGRDGVRHHLRTDDLQRDGHAELLVPGVIHDAHAAGAEHAQDLVARSERLAGNQGAGRRLDGKGRGRAGEGFFLLGRGRERRRRHAARREALTATRTRPAHCRGGRATVRASQGRSAPLGADLRDLFPGVDLVADELEPRGQLGHVEAAGGAAGEVEAELLELVLGHLATDTQAL